jgi:hypothetical protein
LNQMEEDWNDNSEVCCGLLVFQIGEAWSHCPYCGDRLPLEVVDLG